jgi:hypothetical protein
VHRLNLSLPSFDGSVGTPSLPWNDSQGVVGRGPRSTVTTTVTTTHIDKSVVSYVLAVFCTCRESRRDDRPPRRTRCGRSLGHDRRTVACDM